VRSEYAAWIFERYPDREKAAYRCAGAVVAMVEAFPELKAVRGWYGHAAHWWCVAPDGSIVDPTAAQFLQPLEETYTPFRDGIDPEPIGKCMACGEYVWSGTEPNACSPECLADLEAEFNRYVPRSAPPSAAQVEPER
jgi:hypothetical protein